MSGGSTNPVITFGPVAGSSLPNSAFQSPDPSPNSQAYASNGFQPGFNRVKIEGAYGYDQQAPRSQQAQGNYTHHDLNTAGLAQTQALGAYGVGSQQYAEPSRSPNGQAHYLPSHTRHQSLNTGINQFGMGGNGNGAYFGDAAQAPYYNYNLVTSQRSPSGRLTGLGPDDSPTRSRFISAGYQDPRTANRPAPRPLGLGVSLNSSSDDSVKTEGGSPRSLKRAADHMEGSSDHSQLRRPASFPVLGSTSANYGRNAHSVGRRTPGRANVMLPGYHEDGQRESGSSSGTLPSPANYNDGSASSDDLVLNGTVPLIRASQLSATPGPSMPVSDPMSSPPSGSGMGPRARLELHGNLNDMAVGWSHDEWRTGRRLVQFWRRQEGTTIHATFRPILPMQYVPNSIAISCIFREDKNECFVTSVDAIYLLEALVASRFTVEEKNRIRRNLEGFRPITVSKNKRECEAFFKLIMSFPNPKPRNIEKDVKVFPWKVLASALCKIIGKYSASYDGSLPVLGDLGPEPSSFGTPIMGGPSGMDLANGQYRDPNFTNISPQGKETRLSDSALEYGRGGDMYANQYSNNNGNWAANNQQDMFASGAPGHSNYAAYPAQNMQMGQSYDNFGNAVGQQQNGANATLYTQPAQEGYSAAVKSEPYNASQDGGMLSNAPSGEYYTEQRRT